MSAELQRHCERSEAIQPRAGRRANKALRLPLLPRFLFGALRARWIARRLRATAFSTLCLAMTQRRFASELVHLFNCQTACAILRSPDGAQRNPGADSATRIPDCAALHPGYRATCVIAPCSLSGPGARRSSCCLPSPVGACGTTGRFTAPAAPAWFGMRAARTPLSRHTGSGPAQRRRSLG